MFSKTFVLSLSIGVVRDVSFVRCSNFENLKFTGICLQKFVLQLAQDCLQRSVFREIFSMRGELRICQAAQGGGSYLGELGLWL